MLENLDFWAECCNPNIAKPGNSYHAQWGLLISEGHAILRAQQQTVVATVRASRRTMKIAGYTVPVANVPPSMASDAGHLLCQEWQNQLENIDTFFGGDFGKHYPVFSATYYDGADGRRHFSLRSSESGADVSVVAQKYGGGGHKRAAGFSVDLKWNGDE